MLSLLLQQQNQLLWMCLLLFTLTSTFITVLSAWGLEKRLPLHPDLNVDILRNLTDSERVQPYPVCTPIRSSRIAAEHVCCRTDVAGWQPTITCMPHFIIAGMQKSGTTALSALLSSLPMITFSKKKEVHFFDNNKKYKTGQRGYLSYFQPWNYTRVGQREAPLVSGEATPFYLASRDACQRIATAMPTIRVVVLLREPVARMYSEYQMKKRRVDSQDQFISLLTLPQHRNISLALHRCLADNPWKWISIKNCVPPVLTEHPHFAKLMISVRAQAMAHATRARGGRAKDGGRGGRGSDEGRLFSTGRKEELKAQGWQAMLARCFLYRNEGESGANIPSSDDRRASLDGEALTNQSMPENGEEWFEDEKRQDKEEPEGEDDPVGDTDRDPASDESDREKARGKNHEIIRSEGRDGATGKSSVLRAEGSASAARRTALLGRRRRKAASRRQPEGKAGSSGSRPKLLASSSVMASGRSRHGERMELNSESEGVGLANRGESREPLANPSRNPDNGRHPRRSPSLQRLFSAHISPSYPNSQRTSQSTRITNTNLTVAFQSRACLGKYSKERLAPLGRAFGSELRDFERCAGSLLGAGLTLKSLDRAVEKCVRTASAGISKQYYYRSLYAAQLFHCFKYIPRDQFLIISSERLLRKPAEVLTAVLSFLGLRLTPGASQGERSTAFADAEAIAALLRELDPPREEGRKKQNSNRKIGGGEQERLALQEDITESGTGEEGAEIDDEVADPDSPQAHGATELIASAVRRHFPTFESATGWQLSSAYDPLPPGLYQELASFFRPFNHLLTKLLSEGSAGRETARDEADGGYIFEHEWELVYQAAEAAAAGSAENIAKYRNESTIKHHKPRHE